MKLRVARNTPFIRRAHWARRTPPGPVSPAPVSTNAHAQAIRVRMLFGRDHPSDGERRQHLAIESATLSTSSRSW
jgi:hypothetical protein